MFNMYEMRKNGIMKLLRYYESVITEIEIEKLNGNSVSDSFIRSESDKMTAMAKLLNELGLLKAGELGVLYYVIENFKNGDYDLSRIKLMLNNDNF